MKEAIRELVNGHKETLSGKDAIYLQGAMMEEVKNQQKFEKEEDMEGIIVTMVKLLAIIETLSTLQ